MDLVKDTDPEVWRLTLKNYSLALKTKSSKLKPDKKKDLQTLDAWYQDKLPEIIQSRKPKHITHEELCKLMKWKLTRGKFRPRLTELVQTNTPGDVIDASTKAFQALPNLTEAIKALVVLKAVGPATASAVLAAGSPKHAAFMADESMAVLPGLQPIKYDLPFYTAYMSQVSKIVKQLNKSDDTKWTPHQVELALWTYQIARTMDPQLLASLEKLPQNSRDDGASAGPPKKKHKT